MISLLHDVPVPHDQDGVRVPDGGQPVGHNEAGAALHHLLEGLLDADLRAGVDGGGGLVQNQHGRQAQHYPGNAQQLLLPLGNGAAILPDDRVIALGKPLDKAVGVGGLGGLHHFLQGGLRLAIGNVLPNGSPLQPGVLKHHAIAAAQAVAGNPPDVRSLHLDGAFVHIVKPHQQVDDGGLAAAGGANQGHPLAGFHLQVEVLNQGLLFPVGEAHLLDGHLPLGVLEHPGVGVVGDLGPLLNQLEHPARAGQGVLQLCHHAGNLIKGLGVLVGIA